MSVTPSGIRHALRASASTSRSHISGPELSRAFATLHFRPSNSDSGSQPTVKRTGRVSESQQAGSPRSQARRAYSTELPHPSKPPKQGQPLHATHPHLVGEKDLTPGIPASEYESRRRKLMQNLGEGAVVVCMGGTVRLVSQRESECIVTFRFANMRPRLVRLSEVRPLTFRNIVSLGNPQSVDESSSSASD
jgi:hypothetical protein